MQIKSLLSLLILFVATTIHAQTSSLSVTLSNGTNYSLSKDASLFFNGPSTLSSGALSLSNAQIDVQWFTNPQSIDLGSLPKPFVTFFSATTRYSNFVTVSSQGVYQALDNWNPPLVLYFGGVASESFYCSDVSIVGPSLFSCSYLYSNTSLFANISLIAFSTSDINELSATAQIDRNSSATLVNQVFSILAQRLTNVSDTYDVMQNVILTSNYGRRNKAWMLMGGATFCALVAMFAHIGLTSFFLGWALPLFSRHLSSRFERVQNHTGTDTWVWAIILFLVLLITSLPGGLPAYALIGLIYGAIEFALIITYFVKRFLQTRKHSEEYQMDSSDSKSPSEDKERDAWTALPERFGVWQIRGILICAALIVLFIVIVIAIAGGWSIADYFVLDRSSATPLVEIQPASVSKSTLAIYSVHHVATDFKIDFFLQAFTKYCNTAYNVNLTDAEKYEYIEEEYIVAYNIDMSIFARPNYTQYYSINDWFTRTLANGSRYIASRDDNSVITSAADSRSLYFPYVPTDFEITVKEEQFDITYLLGGNATLGALYSNGSMAIFRLAPQDYHRFHSPVNGTIVYIGPIISGTIFSVNAEAVNSVNEVYYNKRQVMIIDTPLAGMVGVVIVGATCVGSITLTANVVGQQIGKGDELGYFQFGGSTLLVLFEAGKVVFDSDLLFSSQMNVETFVEVGSQIARTTN